MNAARKLVAALLNGRKIDAWTTCAIACFSFLCGSLVTSRPSHMQQVHAESPRIFELNVYHAVPGKVPALEARFRDASSLLAKHNLHVVGYWVPGGDSLFADTFIYMVAATTREEMEKNWDAFHADPAFQKYVQSEHAEKLIEKVDSTFMRPTDFSAMK